MEKRRCKVCGRLYTESEGYSITGIRCPNCGYHEGMEGEICKILTNDVIISFSLGGTPSMNAEKVAARIMEEIRKKWPKPVKEKRGGECISLSTRRKSIRE